MVLSMASLALLVAVDGRAEEVFIRASQVPYEVGDPKIAVAFSQAPLPRNFRMVALRDDGDEQEVFEGTMVPISDAAWGSFEHHAELDFSAVQYTGRYLLKVGDAVSLPIEIGRGSYGELATQCLEFMRQQRCGFNPWVNAECHQHDGRTVGGPLPDGTAIDATGGWHDAGDMLQYLLTSGNATAQLLLAYELGTASRNGEPGEGDRPSRLTADEFDARGLPGANGIPDLLDEARWGLDWMLKMHPAPDQLYHQIADDRDHAGWRLPQDEFVDYGWGAGGARPVYFATGEPQGLQQYKSESDGVANLAGRYAAAMALAYQVWKDDPEQREFALRCLKAGREAYELGREKEGVQQGNSYRAPYRYEEKSWADDMEWGAAELYRATGDRGYLKDAKRYARLAADDGWMGRIEARHYEFYPFMNAGHFRSYDLVEPEFQETLAGYYRAGIERCVAAARENPYRLGAPFIWCSNNLVAALATQCLLYERMTGDARYRAFAARQSQWLLGRNPWGTTMLTGIGQENPEDVHLWTVQLLQRPVRGGLVDGPVYRRIFESLKGVHITPPDPFAPFQGLAVYHDDVNDYSTNEPTMDGTASAILLFALLESVGD